MKILLTGRGIAVAETVVQLAVELRKRAEIAVLYTHNEERELLRHHRIRGYHVREIGSRGRAAVERAWQQVASTDLWQAEYEGIRLWDSNEYEILRYQVDGPAVRRLLKAAFRDLLALRAVLGDFRPDVLITWNGIPGEMNMARQWAKRAGATTFCMERGLLPDALVIDPMGVNAQSILCTDHWNNVVASPPSEQSIATVRAYLDRIHAEQRSVVRQGRRVSPEQLRDELRLSENHRLVLVPEQLDWDTNILYNSPDYPTNEDTLRAVLKGCTTMDPVAVLFKPHPENRTPGSAVRVLGSRGHSVGGYNIHSLIEAADLVVVRNSTVGLEAASHDKPVIVLGKAIWSHKGFTYDVASSEQLQDTFQKAVSEGFTPAMRQMADVFLTHVAENCHYFLHSAEPSSGINARMIDQLVAAEPSAPVHYPSRGPLGRALRTSARRQWIKHALRRLGVMEKVGRLGRRWHEATLKPLLNERLNAMRVQLREEIYQEIRREIEPLKRTSYRMHAKLDILHNDHHGMKYGERQVAPTLDLIRDDHLNRYRVASQWVEPESCVLDLGCGIGYGTYIMAKKATRGRVTGLDLSEKAIAYAQCHYAQDNIEHRVDDCLGADFGKSRFDLIVCFEVLEHLPDAGRLLASAAKWLKPCGRLICSTPNQEVVPFDAKQFPYHEKHYTVEQIGAMVEAAGLEMEQTLFQNRHVNFEFDPEGEKYFLVAVCRKPAVSVAAA